MTGLQLVNVSVPVYERSQVNPLVDHHADPAE